ncbi:MAG: hypothetical protein JWM68_3235, partial [Verrucomicrobiales bacterium]|nr:hypothetical protein [Verrucomicrobiales bacterium]
MNDLPAQSNRKMKAIVFILFVISTLAALCALTGANVLGSLN